ncbi:MAG: hypothetical protein ACI9CO_000015 [Candidatus Azotimanducaceae bacterium]
MYFYFINEVGSIFMSMYLSSGTDILNIRKQYSDSGAVIVRSIFGELLANEICKFYDGLSEDTWSWMFHPDPDLEGCSPNVYPNNGSELLNKIISHKRNYVNRLYKSGDHFSYIYQRIFLGDHRHGCNCIECNYVMGFLSSSEFITFLENVTGFRGLKKGEFFVSRYQKGDFNGVHNDRGKGRLAVVVNFTKNWGENDGGIFVALEPDGKTIKFAESPSFNSLLIFDVSNHDSPHFVSHVSSKTKKRVAITGWYT